MGIINTDDFGLNERCSFAIAEAFGKRLITDTTMIVNYKYFEYTLKLSKERNFDNKIGIHFNLTNGTPLTEDIKACSSFVSNGEFHGRIDRLKPLSHNEKFAIYKKLSAQVLIKAA